MSALINTENGLAAGIFQAVIDRIASEQVIPELATTAGAVTYRAPGAGAVLRTVEEVLRAHVSIADYPSLRAAIDALPASGGVVHIPCGRWPAGVWKYDTNYMAREDISLIGERLPRFSDNGDRLVGGAIIEGRFNAWAHGFESDNVGYDLGKIVTDRDFPGMDTHTANHPNGDTWDAFAFAQPDQSAPKPNRKNVRIGNIIGLLRDSQTVGHAVLIEGVEGGSVGNVKTLGGVHGAVCKAKDMTLGNFYGYGASINDVIIKTDTYARASNVHVGRVETNQKPPGVEPWFVPAVCANAFLINAASGNVDTVTVGAMRLFGAATMLHADGGNGFGLDGFHCPSVIIDGAGLGTDALLGINLTGGLKYDRVRLGAVTISNVQDGVAYENTVGGYGADAMEMESLTLTNISMRGIQGLGYGRLKLGKIRAVNVNELYAIDDNARILVGREELINVTTKWKKNAPALTAGWQPKAGFAAFEIRLQNYGVTLKGMLEPTGTPSADVVTLPPYLMPAEPTHMAAIARNAAAVDAMVALKITEGKVTINDGAGIAGAQSYLSLSNINYQMD